MAQILKLSNFSGNNIVAQTQLSADVAVNATSITVVNAEGFTTGYLLIGAIGANNAELLQAASTASGTSISLTTHPALPHSKFDPVYALFGNQIRVYSAPDAGNGEQPADASFSEVSGSPVNIVPNQALTEFTDTGGGSGYWYKQTFFNASDSSETTRSYSTAVRGTFTVNYCSLDDIRNDAGFRNAVYISDDQIEDARQAAQDYINGRLHEFYETPIQPPIPDSLRRITKVLAAGYMRQAEYSQVSNPQVNGQDKIDWAEDEIDKLSMKESVLTDKEGRALDQPGATGGIEGWPNATSAMTPGYQGGAPRVFRMSDIQGRPVATDPSGNPVGNPWYGRRW